MNKSRADVLRERRAHELVLLRRQRLSEIVWRLGARAFSEFVNELDRNYAIPDLDRRLEKYANADPELVALLGGDRMVPNPIWAAPRGEP